MPNRLRFSVGILLSFILGVLISAFFWFLSIENQFDASLSAVKTEIQANQNELVNVIVPGAGKIVTNVKEINDKKHNLEIASGMEDLSDSAFNQFTVSYYQLFPLVEPPGTTALFNEIQTFYNQYNQLNKNIDWFSITVGNSLGFQPQIFSPYLDLLQNQIEELAASTTASSTNVSNDIAKFLDNKPLL